MFLEDDVRFISWWTTLLQSLQMGKVDEISERAPSVPASVFAALQPVAISTANTAHNVSGLRVSSGLTTPTKLLPHQSQSILFSTVCN